MNAVSDPVAQHLLLDLRMTITLVAFFGGALGYLSKSTQKYKDKALKFISEKLKVNLPPVLNVDSIKPAGDPIEFMDNFRDSLRKSGVKTTIHKKLPRDHHYNTVRYLLYTIINILQSIMLICFPCCAALILITVFDPEIYISYIDLNTVNKTSLLLVAFVSLTSSFSCFIAYIDNRS